MTARAVHGQGGKWCTVETVHGRRDRLCLQTKMPSGKQDFGLAERFARDIEPVRQLIGVGGDLMEARQHDETCEAGIQFGRGRGGRMW